MSLSENRRRLLLVQSRLSLMLHDLALDDGLVAVTSRATSRLPPAYSHELSTRALEDDVKREPIRWWAMAALGTTALLNLLWVYWLATLVL